jgi:hypothetical protein
MPLVTCPHCRRDQVVRRELSGLRVACRHCGAEIVAVETPRSKPAPEPAPFPWMTIFASIGLIAVLLLVVGGAFAAIVWVVRDKKPNPAPALAAAEEPLPPPRVTFPKPAEPPPPPPVSGRIETETPESKPLRPAVPAGVDLPKVRSGESPRRTIRTEPAAITMADESPRSAPRPKREVIPGYYLRVIHGFKVLISRMAYDQSDVAEGRPLGYLETEFARLADLFPRSTLKTLATVPIWVEWDHTIPRSVRAYAVYYGEGGKGLGFRGVDPRKARSVCLLSLKTAYALRAKGKSRSLVMLHELAHAVHDQVLGLDNRVIENAYDQAMARRLYRDVRHIDLSVVPVAYAATNDAEYFAELTCCYLDRLDYVPLNRDDLKDYDSVGYELMVKVWGTPEQIDARKKQERAKEKAKENR